MDAITNSFCTVSSCSCGALHVINAGGNQAVTYGGDAALSQTGRVYSIQINFTLIETTSAFGNSGF